MKDDKMILYNEDGSETTLVNPFGPMKALYDEHARIRTRCRS